MDKISKIIPASARTRQIDVVGARGTRPGAPTWAPAPEDRVSMSHQNDGGLKAGPLENYKPSPDAVRARIVEDLANRFFGQSAQSLSPSRSSALVTSERATEGLSET